MRIRRLRSCGIGLRKSLRVIDLLHLNTFLSYFSRAAEYVKDEGHACQISNS